MKYHMRNVYQKYLIDFGKLHYWKLVCGSPSYHACGRTIYTYRLSSVPSTFLLNASTKLVAYNYSSKGTSSKTRRNHHVKKIESSKQVNFTSKKDFVKVFCDEVIMCRYYMIL